MNLNAISFSSAWIVLAQVREAAILAAFPPRALERHLLPILPTASQLLYQKFSQAKDLVWNVRVYSRLEIPPLLILYD